MDNIIKVKISQEDNDTVQAKFYEYNATCDILHRLTTDESIQEKYIDKFTADTVRLFNELEHLKDAITNKYVPADFGKFTYNFDFNECAIEYTRV